MTYAFTIKTPEKTFNYSAPVPYVEAVLYHLELNGLAPSECEVFYNGKQIDLTKKYKVKMYRSRYTKIMNNPSNFRCSKLTPVE